MTTIPGVTANFEDGTPYPEFLIKSIAEQGYSLETSLADLIDNSVTAGADKVEILIDTENLPFTLFLADNGNGMNEKMLGRCMKFPSSSMESERSTDDLGRFGLGMKTASFAQTRKFTALSRTKEDDFFAGRTWDVAHLKQVKEWQIIINEAPEIKTLFEKYQILSLGYLNNFEDFRPGTLVAWQGLYKFEDYLSGTQKSDALKYQISEVTTEYLSLVFHRFMEKTVLPLQIRVNNVRLKPFNPFPPAGEGVRMIESKQKAFSSDVIRLEGFILPVRSIEESKERINSWCPPSRGLMDMEGLYIYRSDRIILFGGWNGIIRKSPRLQLARLRVEVGNKVDNLLHLNVSKSQIAIPFDLKTGFLKYIAELKQEAEKEYYNRGIKKISSKKSDEHQQLFERKSSNKGTLLELNDDFPLINMITEKLDNGGQKSFRLLLRMINTSVNRLRHAHEDQSFAVMDSAGASDNVAALETVIKELLDKGISKQNIKTTILPALGFRIDTIPKQINQLIH